MCARWVGSSLAKVACFGGERSVPRRWQRRLCPRQQSFSADPEPLVDFSGSGPTSLLRPGAFNLLEQGLSVANVLFKNAPVLCSIERRLRLASVFSVLTTLGGTLRIAGVPGWLAASNKLAFSQHVQQAVRLRMTERRGVRQTWCSGRTGGAGVGSILNDADRAAIIQRLGSVTSAAVPRWGRMDAKRMSAHLSLSVLMALGFRRVRATGFFRYSQSSISSCMWCRSRKARRLRRSFCHQTPERWTHWLELVSLVERIEQDRSKAWGRFTRYSAGSHSARGAAYKHTDHHLRQFGA